MVEFASLCDENFNYDIEQWNAAKEYSRRHSIHWDDLLAYNSCLIEHSEEAKELISRLTETNPPEEYLAQYEPFVRALFKQYYQGQISDKELFDQAKQHLSEEHMQ